MSEPVSTKGSFGTVVAVGGLIVSLLGNYMQFKKNSSDAQIAEQQVAIAQQQAATAREELSLKQKQLDDQQAIQNRTIQNCNQLLVERDDALKAVHIYDNSITKHQAGLQVEKTQLAMAEADHDSFRMIQHRSLAENEQNAINSLTVSRDQASARVSEIERNCK